MTADTLDTARERLRPHVERAQHFTGWLALPTPRPLGPDKPWDYIQRAQQLLANLAESPFSLPSPQAGRGLRGGVPPCVLDLGTGGGERFAALLESSGSPSAASPESGPPSPSTRRGLGGGVRPVATEEWSVNAPIAAATLRPHNASVVHCTSLLLPFADATFDLILSRHEAITPSEVARTLRPSGAFLTQQTWRFLEELHYYIPRTTDFGDHFNGYGSGLHAAGLTIADGREHVLPHAFDSLEDLVYLLCIASWEIPDFDPLGKDLQPLLALERDLTTPEGLTLTCGHYIIEAHKPT